jgi:lysozyme
LKAAETDSMTRKQTNTIGGLPVLLLTLVLALSLSSSLRQWLVALIPTQSGQTDKHFGIPIPTDFEVHGIDVSKHQDKINWQKVGETRNARVSIEFAFMKATEGTWLTDSQFKHNWEGTARVGIIRGAYHYSLPDLSPRDQAKHFFSQVKLQPGDLPPALDVEETRGMKKRQIRQYTLEMLHLLEKNYKTKPILYTNRDFYTDYFADEPALQNFPLWIAHYRVEKLVLPGDAPWMFWQHNDRGSVAGIRENVDFNTFRGDKSELINLCIN